MYFEIDPCPLFNVFILKDVKETKLKNLPLFQRGISSTDGVWSAAYLATLRWRKAATNVKRNPTRGRWRCAYFLEEQRLAH